MQTAKAFTIALQLIAAQRFQRQTAFDIVGQTSDEDGQATEAQSANISKKREQLAMVRINTKAVNAYFIAEIFHHGQQ